MNTKLLRTIVLFAGILVLAAADHGTAQEKKKKDPPPLPFHCCEGAGGVFSTQTAYLVNPSSPDRIFGLPSVGTIYVGMNHGRSLTSLTATETLFGRVELGYAFVRFGMGDLPDAIETAMGVGISDDDVDMQVINGRVMVIKDGAFDRKWMPAITLGVHYKNNMTIDDLDRELGGALTGIGIADNEGIDYSIHVTKMITKVLRPAIVTVGARLTEGAHIGLLGFTDDEEIVLEGSIAVLATERLVVGAEYRQKPNEYTSVSGLIEKEDDWWTVEAGYIINPHLTIAVGYGHFGNLLNHKADDSFGVAVKAEL